MYFLQVNPRLYVVIALLFAFGLARRSYRSWRAGLAKDQESVPRLPKALRGSDDRTWVIFTSPLCATCGPVEEALRAHDPAAAVVKVDVTERPDLADQYRVRTAPTVFMASGRGKVSNRLVGASAVNKYVRSGALARL